MRIIFIIVVLILVFTQGVLAKTLVYDKSTKNPNQLHEEILDSFPEWRGTSLPNGTFRDPLIQLESNELSIILTVPDNADEARIKAIVNSHVSNPNWLLSRNPDSESKKSAKAKLKVLGFTDGEVQLILK